MGRYRFIFGDASTGDLYGELPATQAMFSYVLNGPGAFTCRIPYEAAGEVSGVTPGRTTIHVERDGLVVWSGMLWTLEGSAEDRVVSLGAEGWLSYFRRRLIRSTLKFSAVKGPTIAKALLDYAQGVTGGDVGVDTTGAVPAGVDRDHSYFSYERKPVGEALEQLAALNGGFDFAFVPSWDVVDSRVLVRFVTSFPETGRETDLVFHVGGNVEVAAVQCDGTSLAHTVDAIGAGEGSSTLIRSASTGLAGRGWPLLEDVVSYTDVKVSATLQAHADRRRNRGRAPMLFPSLQVDPDADPVFGSYAVGDRVSVDGRVGFVDLSGRYRITEQSVSIDSAGPESVGLTLAPTEVFDYA